MTMRNKQELIQQMINLLNAMIKVEKIEMLTIKKCAQQISGYPSMVRAIIFLLRNRQK